MKNSLIAGGIVLAGIVGAMTLGGSDTTRVETTDNPYDRNIYNFDTQTQEPPKKTLTEDNDYSTERSYEEFEDRDCGDFSSQTEAQRFFESEGGPSYDPHGLDRDKDGIACESI